MIGLPLTRPTMLLRLEGGAALGLVLWLYGAQSGNWLLFGLLFLVPDLSALGYRAGPVVGAACYNAVHTTLLPVALAGAGLAGGARTLVTLALIWGAHIAWDRLMADGLKYPDAFKHTHLGAPGDERP